MHAKDIDRYFEIRVLIVLFYYLSTMNVYLQQSRIYSRGRRIGQHECFRFMKL